MSHRVRARKADGSTALAAVVGYLVMQAVFKTMSPFVLTDQLDKAGEQAQINYSVFGGIVVGLITATLFDRYHTITSRPTSDSSAAAGSCRSQCRWSRWWWRSR